MAKSGPYKNRIGTFVKNQTTDEAFKAYCPKPLPPNPPLDFTAFAPQLEAAHHALGILDGASLYSPIIDVFLYCYIRKEALLSSQIEGTQSTLSDLLLYESKELPGVPLEDVEEVSNYVAAIRYGLSRLKTLPISLRLIKELHGVLLKGTRGQSKTPGEFRRTQNWIGGSKPSTAIFVPPPPNRMLESLSDLEKFIHENSQLPALIKIALIHVQFETIHPFLDGNGRLGRLLITLLLIHENLQQQPLLYLSLYLKNNRDTYYSLLQKVRMDGVWEEWILFFLKAVTETATQAAHAIVKGQELISKDTEEIKKLGIHKSSTSLLLHKYMQKHLISTIKKASSDLKITQMTITKAFIVLSEMNIIKEITGKSRGRIFVYKKYFSLIDEGTKPL